MNPSPLGGMIISGRSRLIVGASSSVAETFDFFHRGIAIQNSLEPLLVEGTQALFAGNFAHFALGGIDRYQVRDFRADGTEFHQSDPSSVAALPAIRTSICLIEVGSRLGKRNVVRRKNLLLLRSDIGGALTLAAKAPHQTLCLSQGQGISEEVGRQPHGDEATDCPEAVVGMQGGKDQMSG